MVKKIIKISLSVLSFVYIFMIIDIKTYKAADIDYLPSKKDCELLVHRGYVACFNKKYRQAIWVAYELTEQELTVNTKRMNRFHYDYQDKEYTSLREDYLHSGYDRGHLAPSRDLLFSKKSMLESFYYSNISPQNKYFNRGIWSKLEQQVRKWAKNYKKLYIVTAGVMKGKKLIGKNKILVPESFYKIVYAPEQDKMIAFLIPHSSIKNINNLKMYMVSVDEVEEITGLNFFGKLDDHREEFLEKHISNDIWE